MEIFNLTIQDIEKYSRDIITLLKQSFKKSFPEKEFDDGYYNHRVEVLKTYVSKGKAIVYGAEKNEELLGFIWFFNKDVVDQKLIHVNHFVVHEDFRRLGIGKKLWNEVERYADRIGASEIELFVTKDNKGAVDFYVKKDFEIERLVMKKRLLK